MDCFLWIPYDHLAHYNWGTAPLDERDEWQCNDETYINGVLLTMDFDYMMGYLIEVVDRTSGQVNYHAITTFHGRDPITHKQEHDSVPYEKDCGTFFERTEAADIVTVSQWAVSVIVGMIESYQDGKAATRKAQERRQTS